YDLWGNGTGKSGSNDTKKEPQQQPVLPAFPTDHPALKPPSDGLCYFDLFPNELLVIIFSFLPSRKDFTSCSEVCFQWNAVLKGPFFLMNCSTNPGGWRPVRLQNSRITRTRIDFDGRVDSHIV